MPNFALANSAAMALYSVGKTEGLVIKSGDAFTQAVPVFEGQAVGHAKKSAEFGGRPLTTELQRLLLQDDKSHFDQLRRVEVVTKAKEDLCRVYDGYGPEELPEQKYKLPDK